MNLYRQQPYTLAELNILQNQRVEPVQEPLSQKMGRGIGEFLLDQGVISDPRRAYRTGQTMSGILGFLPGIGDAQAGDEFATATREGDALGMGLGLMSAIPFVGRAKKGVESYLKDVDLPEKFLGDPVLNYGDVIPGLKETPERTRKAYKLFVQGEGDEIFPLFVDARTPVPQGQWMPANAPNVTFRGKRTPRSEETFYVPTKGAARSKGEEAKKTGDPVIIPDQKTRNMLLEQGFITERSKPSKDAPFGKVIAVAARPGWHASVIPTAEHLGPMSKISAREAKILLDSGVNPKSIRTKKNKETGVTQYYVKRRADDQVWAEVDMGDDTSEFWSELLDRRGTSDITDQVPRGGSYIYRDGQASEDWMVGGDMRVNRVLSPEEAKQVQQSMGVLDLPTTSEVNQILGREVK